MFHIYIFLWHMLLVKTTYSTSEQTTIQEGTLKLGWGQIRENEL